MKKFLLLSHYAPKPDFSYPDHDCPLAHRETAHKRIRSLDRFWDEGALWQTVEVENTSLDALLSLVQNQDWDGIWLSGSPYLLSEAKDHPWINNSLKLTEYLLNQSQTPVIGICFGLQLLAAASGGEVLQTDEYKAGETDVFNAAGEILLRTKVYHENFVSNLPPSAEILGQTKCGMPYIVKFSKKVLGIQSHPECALELMSKKQKAEKFWQNQFKALVA